MNITYKYDSSTDWGGLTKETKFNTRLAGCFLIVLGLIQVLSDGWTESSNVGKLCALVWVLIGLAYILFPVKASKPFRGFKNEYLTIDDDKIEWNLGNKSKIVQLKISELSGWTTKVGEVHFKTKNGEVHSLSTHKIYSSEKHKEFYQILKEDLSKRIA